jgi:O-antigen ligase
VTGWLARIALFVVFLFPVVVDQYSVNYLFAVFAIFAAVSVPWAERLRTADKLLLVAIALYTLIYVAGVSIDLLNGGGMLVRRTISFAIFMTIFAFSVVDVGESDIRAFKIALISIAAVYSLQALLIFFMVGGSGYGFGLKNVVGSQRYGFVYLLALFTLIHLPHVGRWGMLAKMIAGYIIMAGLLLTFSRSSIIALLAVLPFYLLAPLIFKSVRSKEGIRVVRRRVAVGLAYAVALFVVMPVTLDFYGAVILSRYTVAFETALILPEGVPPPPEADIFVADGSEGTRLKIWSAIINHTMANPLTGSSFIGSWALDGASTGSAHNQYFDVAMRTGLPGITMYLLILARLFLFLWRRDQGFFWGGLAVLVYGVFHETFKESQGAFILAFLIGMQASHQRSISEPAKQTKTAS